MPDDRSSQRFRRAILTAAALRYAIPIAAIPLVPVLVPERVPLLVVIRPGKEILLLAGGLWRATGSPSMLAVFLAYLPLMVGGVWVFFLLGRSYAAELRAGDGPDWLHRLVPDEQLALARRVLASHGPIIAVLARVAALPPTIVAAAAGTSTVDGRRYLAADLVGAIAAFGITVGLGVALGNAYERGGIWLTATGVVVVLVLFVLVSRWAQREAERSGAAAPDPAVASPAVTPEPAAAPDPDEH